MRKQEKRLGSKRPSAAVLAMLLLVVLMSSQVKSFTTNGTQKTFEFDVTSGKNNNLQSSSFRNYLVVGDTTATAGSSNFKTEIGLLGVMPYLNGEACQTALECVGGYCCSSLCSSSACPTAAVSAASAGAAAGGGGGEVPVQEIKNFTIDKDIINAVIKQGGTYKTKFSVKNTGTVGLSFNIDASALQDILLLSDTQFTLAPNDVKDIDATIFASEEKKPDVYTGNIRINADGISKSLPLIVEVRAKKALFDIVVKVLPQHKYVLKDEAVEANITLTNVGDLKPVDAHLNYAIRDIEGKDLMLGSETLAVYNKVSMTKELELPFNIS